MAARQTTPPMAIMASGDSQAQPQQSVQARPTLPKGQNGLEYTEPPLELPPSFRKFLHDVKTKDPTILDRRYQEFLEAEMSSSPVEEGGVVKLTRIYIPEWAEMSVNEYRSR